MERCAICLDENPPPVSEANINKCDCIVFVHNECLNLWRIQSNHCIICRESLQPIPFHIRIYYCSYDEFITRSVTLKTVYWCIYAFCMYQFMIFAADLFFYSFLMSFDIM